MLRTAGDKIKKRAKAHPVLEEFLKTSTIVFGAVLVAVGLELFLVPNGFLDGGVVGISIILTEYISLPLGVFIGILNIPFLIIGFKFLGWRIALRSALGIATLSGATILFHGMEPLTDEFTLALGYGGLLLGVGVGIALRYGGALDGTEILSVALSDKMNMSVDQIILFINFFIFLVAAFVFTPERAMASLLLFYIVVTPIIKKIVDGASGGETKTVQILSVMHSEITEAIHTQMNKKVVLLDGHTDDLDKDNEVKVLFTFVSRIEESELIDLVEDIDSEAIVVFSDVATIRGGKFNTTKHH
jgi:uncharacterized membrane-anchored protein YitT (DUF2179 family)